MLHESCAKSSEVDNEGRIPLLLAAQEGHLNCVKSLVRAGSHVNSHAHDGKTALRAAALENHMSIVQYLVNNNADFNYKDADGRSTLYVLALENRIDIAKYLLEKGANVESSDLEGRTPLHVAAWQGHVEIVKQLLLHSAEINGVDNDSRTALQSAAWQGHTGVVQVLISHGASVDHTCNQGATALCIAAQEGHDNVVKVLLKAGANPNHADQFGRTAMRVATKGKHLNVVTLLEGYGVASLTPVSSHHKESEQNIVKSRHKEKNSSSQNRTTNGTKNSHMNGKATKTELPTKKSDIRNQPLDPAVQPSINITSNPHANTELSSGTASSLDDATIWQQRSNSPLERSPDSRRKRNGIATNPNFPKPISINGYFNKLSNIPLDQSSDTVPPPLAPRSGKDTSQSSMQTKRSVRPQELLIKKETPL